MHCPYCTSEINDAALACPHCTRDLYLFKPLLERIGALETRVQELEVFRDSGEIMTSENSVEGDPTPPTVATGPSVWIIYWLSPLLLLLLAHFLITVVYDLNTLYLRIVSLLIPLPFAFLLMRENRSFGIWSAAGFALGGIAALGMSTSIAMIDHTPVLPQTVRDWREFIEYSASMGLSFLSGIIFGNHLRTRREAAQRKANGLTVQLAKLITSGTQNAEKLNATISKLRELSNSLAIAATSTAAAYAGLKGFIGG